jgi:hypothetical protein
MFLRTPGVRAPQVEYHSYRTSETLQCALPTRAMGMYGEISPVNPIAMILRQGSTAMLLLWLLSSIHLLVRKYLSLIFCKAKMEGRVRNLSDSVGEEAACWYGPPLERGN